MQTLPVRSTCRPPARRLPPSARRPPPLVAARERRPLLRCVPSPLLPPSSPGEGVFGVKGLGASSPLLPPSFPGEGVLRVESLGFHIPCVSSAPNTQLAPACKRSHCRPPRRRASPTMARAQRTARPRATASCRPLPRSWTLKEGRSQPTTCTTPRSLAGRHRKSSNGTSPPHGGAPPSTPRGTRPLRAETGFWTSTRLARGPLARLRLTCATWHLRSFRSLPRAPQRSSGTLYSLVVVRPRPKAFYLRFTNDLNPRPPPMEMPGVVALKLRSQPLNSNP